MTTEIDMDWLDEVGLELGVPRSGRSAMPVQMELVREIDSADLAALSQAKNLGTGGGPVVKELRSRHHQLARLLAEGTAEQECALITGYSASRISILKADPAFKELVEYYTSQTKEVFLNVHERLAGLGMAALEELAGRLEDKPEALTNRELLEVMSAGLDRSGYGPKSTQVHEFAVSSEGLLNAVKAEVSRRQTGEVRILDARSNRKSSGLEGPAMGGTPDRTTEGDPPD